MIFVAILPQADEFGANGDREDAHQYTEVHALNDFLGARYGKQVARGQTIYKVPT